MSEPTETSPSPPDAGDVNVERLLQKAYRPEVPDAAFIGRVEEDMYSIASTPISYRMWSFGRVAAAGAAVAAVVLIAIGIMMSRPRSAGPDIGYYGSRSGGPGPSIESVEGAVFAALAPRPRAQAPLPQRVSVGQSIQTKATERRRVVLADGSVLYMNQNTSVRVEGERRISLAGGEVFVEVSPRGAGGERFVVKTPGREVSALGTKFDVLVNNEGTGVLVTQGKVKVTGVETPVVSGQQLAPEKVKTDSPITPAPRASRALDWTQELMGAAESPLVPDSEYQGGAIIVVDPYGQQARLSLRKYNIDVHVEDGFARTTIDQTYFNHENRRQEGTFYFPLPADASLNRLAMYVEGKLMEGGMAERDYARSVYEQILYTRRDPALLEWMDGSTFKMRVFPLEPRQEKRILISYVQKLPGADNQAEYRFPAGHNLEMVRDWAFHAVVKNGLGTHWSSDTHALISSQVGGDLVLDASAKSIKPDRDIVVRLYNSERGQSLGDIARFCGASHEGSRYLMLRYRPNLPSQPQRERRDWVFLFESSGNRDPLLARVQVDVIKTILENAEEEDTFNIITAATRTALYSDGPQAVTAENIKAAVGFLEKTHLVGALDLGKALAATEPLVSAAQNPYLVHVGAGVSALGERREDVLVQRIPHRAKYVGIGVGKQWSRQLMKTAAARTGGYFTQINPDEQITWRAFDLVAALNTPRLLDIKVADSVGQVAFLGFTDSLSQGEELAAVARIDATLADPRELTITGTLDGQRYKQTVSVGNVAPEAGYLARAWAKLEIDRLLADNGEANKSRIIELSKAMYVMSPFTSLLVLENEQMYEQFKVDRGRKDHWAMYSAPEKIEVVYEPDASSPAGGARTSEAAGQKPPAEQILQTIMVRIPVEVLRWPNEQYPYGGQGLTAVQVYGGADLMDYYIDEDLRQAGGRGDGLRWFRGDGDLTMSQWGMRNGPGAFDRLGTIESQIISRPLQTPMRTMAGAVPAVAGRTRETMAGLSVMQDESRRRGGPEMLGIVRQRVASGEEELFSRGKWANMKTYSGVSGLLWRGEGLAVGGGDLDRAAKLKRSMAESELIMDRPIDGRFNRPVRGWFRDRSVNRNFLYQRPYFSGDWRFFGDLARFAPGMNTTLADIEAVLEAEAAADPLAAPGRIDPAARKLIEKARGTGWQSVTIRPGARQVPFAVTFDGSGRFTYERTLGEGLREQVVCDGTTLWHLYPDLGIGSERAVSRFHRAEFASVVPWYLPPAEDLARGFDLVMVDEHTVAVVPRTAEQGKPATQPTTQPSYARIHLVFDADGSLRERRVVEMPSGKTLRRQTCSPSGVVQVFDADGKEMAKEDLSLKDAQFVSLKPDTRDLVVLPLPLRTREFVAQSRKLKDDGKYVWSREDALAVIAADLANNGQDMMRVIAHRFFRNGDRRIGFYTLAVSSGNQWDPKKQVNLGGNDSEMFDPAVPHPNSALARYIADHLEGAQHGYNIETAAPDAAKIGFMDRLGNLRYLHSQFNSGRANQGDEAQRKAHRQRAFDFIRTCRDPYFGWAVLSLVYNYGNYGGLYEQLAEAAKSLQEADGLSYAARYEYTCALHNSGQADQAKRLFAELYKQALDRGVMPAIDHQFRNAFQRNDAGRDEFAKLMRDAAAALMGKAGRLAGVYMAWQCHQLGEGALAGDLFASAMLDVPESERLATTLAAVDYLWNTGQAPQADALIEPLLADKEYGKYPELWRLGSVIATGRGMIARSLARLERAIDLEYESLPAVVNVQVVRSDYGQLLQQYQQLADAITTLEKDPPRDFLAKTIRYADRWRSLDPDDTAACQAAARILRRFDARDLAWDYLTTPLADRPSEAGPWQSLAAMLRQEGEWQLADRAYATAFDVEPTNAQILWDRAQLLQQVQRLDEARKLYRQLADGQWQPRFSWIQNQARTYVRGN